LTQDQLAERAGTERSHISALERAEKGPALATIFKLAEALGISAAELIGLVEQKMESRRR
jgi:transcriptional regulator with XRE-family HTH domain